MNDAPLDRDGHYVLYWMIANRRAHSNFALQRAAEWAASLGKPLVVLEALRCGYPWASDRLHRFILQGMADNQAAFANSQASYFPYVESEPGEGKGLLESLAASACLVVSDEFPCFFLPRMVAATAARVPVHFEIVDSNGILPMRAASQVYPTAYAFRRFLQKNLPSHLDEFPNGDPLEGLRLPRLGELPKNVTSTWQFATASALSAESEQLARLPLDHTVGPAIFSGGSREADKRLTTFIQAKLAGYSEGRSEPEQDASSGLSPYLHFGHISIHAIVHAVLTHEAWSLDKLAKKSSGQREGWWGISPSAEGFLDESITWRELGFNMCWQRDDYDQYESLPGWARVTLEQHASDPRPTPYDLAILETAQTHDRLWNAAQSQLVREGRMHNYLRMLWGKKILEWSSSPREALRMLIHLNNKYAVDGRNPNSYSGIFWCLGRYDRPWGPERPIFGKIRYMSSDNTAKKFSVRNYLERFAPPTGRQPRLFDG